MVDMWSVGCVIGEMLNKSPVFPVCCHTFSLCLTSCKQGDNDIDQLVCVFRLLGSPSEQTWPGMKDLPDYGKIDFPNYDAVNLLV
jgi:cell cycle related kinase